MEGSRPHFHIIGLQNHAAMLRPKPVQCQDQPLKGTLRVKIIGHFVIRHRQFVAAHRRSAQARNQAVSRPSFSPPAPFGKAEAEP